VSTPVAIGDKPAHAKIADDLGIPLFLQRNRQLTPEAQAIADELAAKMGITRGAVMGKLGRLLLGTGQPTKKPAPRDLGRAEYIDPRDGRSGVACRQSWRHRQGPHGRRRARRRRAVGAGDGGRQDGRRRSPKLPKVLRRS